MKQENRIFEKFLNVLVLLGSLFIIIIVSIELLSVRPVLSEQFILNTHLIVCFIFLLDFFVRWFYSGQGWRFMWRNLLLLPPFRTELGSPYVLSHWLGGFMEFP